jgi:5'-nucleotidase (lipoprotein e(P4) family)
MRVPLSVFALLLLLTSFTADKPQISKNDHLTLAVLYHQTAPEYRALCYQAYNLATVRMNQIVKRKGSADGLAVVLDLDETVLDNSPFEAKCVLDNVNYPAFWGDWCNLAKAEAVPGAAEFLNHAHALGVQIVYVSNRKEEFRKVTKDNLATLNLPAVKDEYLLLRDKESSKAARRAEIAKTHEIILLIGDNLNDFNDDFEKTTGGARMELTNMLKKSFAEKYIVLPNPMYGEWESELYKKEMSENEQRDARYKALKGF